MLRLDIRRKLGKCPSFSVVLKDEPELRLHDEGKGSAVLGVTECGPGLFLHDEKGKQIWSAPR